MSDRMRLDEAILYAEFRPVKRNMGRAARTIIAQAEQIERLQRAFETALSEINDLSEETYNHMAGPFHPRGPSDYGLTAGDMEVTDER